MVQEAGAPKAPPAAPVDAASLPAGYRINEYSIERPLGGGGFGITYLARDLTNIVSPGFAPFEQYHSQGNQGPGPTSIPWAQSCTG